MFRRILVPTDGSELCAKALDTALRLAQLSGGGIVGLHVFLPLGPLLEPAGATPGVVDPAQAALDHAREQQAIDALQYVRRRALDAGVPCETVLARAATAHEAIERVAREQGCDLVVLAARPRRGLRARLLGGDTDRLLAHGTLPLLIVR